jgi:hypothetical protein
MHAQKIETRQPKTMKIVRVGGGGGGSKHTYKHEQT